MFSPPPPIGPAANGHMTVQDVTSLLTYVSDQITKSEENISDRLDTFEGKLDLIGTRVGALEKRNDDEDIKFKVRTEPIGYIGEHWRTIMLVVMCIAGSMGFLSGIDLGSFAK